jgi:hypothetical protein
MSSRTATDELFLRRTTSKLIPRTFWVLCARVLSAIPGQTVPQLEREPSYAADRS